MKPPTIIALLASTYVATQDLLEIHLYHSMWINPVEIAGIVLLTRMGWEASR